MDDTFLNDLRKALNNLYDLNQLRNSSLCKLFGMDNPFDAPVRLQRVLEDAINTLKPKSREAHLTHAWQIYELLSLRYLQQFSQKEVADQIGVSLSHMNRIQRMALEDLAVYLGGKYVIEGKNSQEKEPGLISRQDQGKEMPSGKSEASLPAQPEQVAADLEWLAVPSPEKSSDLVEQLGNVLAIIQPFLTKYSVALNLADLAEPLEVLVYPVALRQILLNLLTSAIHILSGGQMHLKISRLESGIQLLIDGSGQASDLADESEDLKTNLEIAARFTHLSGGNLDLEVEQNRWQAVLHLPGRAAIPVLIIDDSLDALQLMERFVADTPYRVIGASNPQQVIALAESSHAQIIIIDVMMPQVDGWELLQKLRHHPVTAHLPLVTCSILRQEELALSLGASAYLRKPVSQEGLLEVLDRLSGNAALKSH